MNGWFMHDLSQFPPSEKITPVFISFHCQYENLIKNNVSYFKKYEPIGCRDVHTQILFTRYNIWSYFSGCLTLCFDEVDCKDKNSNVYVVDINDGCNNILKVNREISTLKNIIKKQHYIHNKNTNIQKRLEQAQNLLDCYKYAKLVITTRLHCALPCRAFNTKVKFIHKNYKTDIRFSGLHHVLNGSDDNVHITKINESLDKEVIDSIKLSINTKFKELITKYTIIY